MTQRFLAVHCSALVSVGLAAFLGVAFADSAAAGGANSKQRKDAQTCESFGNSYGTPAYSDCMLSQQQRRDTKKIRSLDESQRLSQLARDGQVMADRARRQRCDRNPDRRECGR